MTEKRYKLTSDDENFLVVTFNGNELSQIDVVQTLNGFIKENEQLKQLLDLFASDICKVTELLDDNNIEYELYNDVENFIVKWGVRIE